jgi:formiminotetrahydrofolate cyclodeaminase
MASPHPHLDLTLREWLDELARSHGVPGGGSALGFAVATGAAVLAMAARASGSGGFVAQADMLRARTAPLAERDAETYAAALAVREANDGLEAEQRDWQIGRAFAAAAEPPLDIARAGADVAELAAQLAESGDLRVRADALAAAALGVAAARGAVALVAANLTALPGDPRIVEVEQLADAAERSQSRVR